MDEAICRAARVPCRQTRIGTIPCIIHGLLNYLLPLVDELGRSVNVVDGPADPGGGGAAWKLPYQLEAGRLGEDGRVRERGDLVIHSILKAKADRLIVGQSCEGGG